MSSVYDDFILAPTYNNFTFYTYSVLTHGNINNCDDKIFILVDSVSTLSIMNGSSLTPTFKN